MSVISPPSTAPAEKRPKHRSNGVRAHSARARNASRRRRSWGSVLFVLLVAGGLIWLSLTTVEGRLEARSHMELDRAILTAEPIEIQAIEGGTILDTRVTIQQAVQEGDVLAVLRPPRGSLGGTEPIEITSPARANVLTITSAGATLSGGSTIALLYDPNDLHFEAPVEFDALPEVRIGMTAFLEFPSIDEVETRLTRVETILPGSGTEGDSGSAMLILEPTQRDVLASVVPGVVLEGWIDLDSAPPGAPTGLSSVGTG